MRHHHLAAFGTAVAIAAMASVPLAGQSEAQEAADAGGGLDDAAVARRAAGPAGATGRPRRSRLSSAPSAWPTGSSSRRKRWPSCSSSSRRRASTRCGGMRSPSRIRRSGKRRCTRRTGTPATSHYDNQVWLRTPVPKGLSTPAHLADHVSAERPDSAADAGGGRAGGPRSGDGHRVRRLRDPALMERCGRLDARGTAAPAAGLQRHPSDLPDPGPLRAVHGAGDQSAADHGPRRWAGHPGRDSLVRRRLARPLGGRHAGRGGPISSSRGGTTAGRTGTGTSRSASRASRRT